MDKSLADKKFTKSQIQADGNREGKSQTRAWGLEREKTEVITRIQERSATGKQARVVVIE